MYRYSRDPRQKQGRDKEGRRSRKKAALQSPAWDVDRLSDREVPPDIYP